MSKDLKKYFDQHYIKLINSVSLCDADLNQYLRIIAQHCAAALTTDRIEVWLFERDTSVLRLVHQYPDKDAEACIQLDQIQQYLPFLENSRVVEVSDALSDQRVEELTDLHLLPKAIGAFIDVPLRQNNCLLGLLRFATSEGSRDWTLYETMFAESVGGLFGQRLITEKIEKQEALYGALYNGINEGVFILNGERISDVNAAACRLFDGTRDQLIGLTPIHVSPPLQPDGMPSPQKALDKIHKTMQGQAQRFEWLHKRLDDSEFYAEISLNAVVIRGKPEITALIRDISARKQAQLQAEKDRQEIEYWATHDALTKLENRNQMHRYFNKLMDEKTTKAGAGSAKIVLMLFDLNRFKDINDTAGHHVGDQVLQRVAEGLASPIKKNNGRLFRLGGDEFVAVFFTERSQSNFAELSNLIHQSLKTDIHVNGLSFAISASIGVSIYPDHGDNSHELLRCADVAMYSAKSRGFATVFHDMDTDSSSRRRLSLTLDFHDALRNNELCLYYQPRIDIATKKVVGIESLVRWQHPKYGLVMPNEFIPVVEMTELIQPLSEWVLVTSLRQVKALLAKGYEIPLAINLSARNLIEDDIVETFRQNLTAEGVEPSMLEVEITESTFITQPQIALKNLKLLHELGVALAIDDFGAGYSSLSYLSQLSVDMLKIDREFIHNLVTNEANRMIAGSIIHLGHALGLAVVAEGVEDEPTLAALQDLQCDQAQGYLLSRPMPEVALHPWLLQYHQRVFTGEPTRAAVAGGR